MALHGNLESRQVVLPRPLWKLIDKRSEAYGETTSLSLERIIKQWMQLTNRA